MIPSDYGLPHSEFYPHQLETIQWAKGVQAVGVIEASTGSGKTTIPAALSSKQKLITLVKTKFLQEDNYERGYEFVPLYGRGNYACPHNGGTALDCTFTKGVIEDKYGKERAVGMADCPDAPQCGYFNQREAARLSQKTVLNYPYWLHVHQSWPAPEVLVCDEGHQLPEIILEWAGTTIKPEAQLEWGLPMFPMIRSNGSKSAFGSALTAPEQRAVSWLVDAAKIMKRHTTLLGEKAKYGKEARKELRKAELLENKLKATLDALVAAPHDWFIRSGPGAGDPSTGSGQAFIARPLTARHHFKHYFVRGWKLLIMSATIGDDKVFAAELGLPEHEFLRVPSRFTPEQKPVFALDVPRLGQKSKPTDWDKQADEIARGVKECPPTWSGIIHVTSYAQSKMLAERLAKRGLSSRLSVPKQGESTAKVVQDWHERMDRKPGSLLITPVLSEGYDGRLERININAKCFTPDVKLFGPNGYLDMETAKPGDQVFAIDGRGNFVVDTVKRVVRSQWDGDVVDFKSARYDVTVTDNHNMLFQFARGKGERYRKREAKDIPNDGVRLPVAAKFWSGTQSDHISFEKFFDDETLIYYRPSTRRFRWGHHNNIPDYFEYSPGHRMYRTTWGVLKNQEWKPSPEDKVWFSDRKQATKIPYYWGFEKWAKLIAWFTTEGYGYSANGIEKIAVVQNEGEKFDQIVDLVEQLGLQYNVQSEDRKRVVNIHSQVLYRAFTHWCGKGAKNKYLPEEITGCDRKVMSEVYKVMIAADGHKGRCYTTASPRLAQQFCEIALKLGYSPAYSFSDNCFNIGVAAKQNRGTVSPRNKSTHHYEGEVWCVETEITGNVLAARNGKFLFTGNCPYPALSDDYSRCRQEYNHTLYLQRTAWILEQMMGRVRRGPEDYDTGGERMTYNALGDGGWRYVKKFFSQDFVESIVT